MLAVVLTTPAFEPDAGVLDAGILSALAAESLHMGSCSTAVVTRNQVRLASRA